MCNLILLFTLEMFICVMNVDANALAVVECGKRLTNEKNFLNKLIIGGHGAKNNSWPWMVSIRVTIPRHSEGTTYVCGGTLITQRFVLSAANCYKDLKKQVKDTDFEVILGSRYKEPKNGEDYVSVEVSNIIMHDLYDHNGDYNDIALIKLFSDVMLTDNIKLICLPIEGETPQQSNIIITGWGAISKDGPDNDTFQEAELQLVDFTDCQTAYHNIKYPYKITRDMICAIDENYAKNTSQDDVGGPMVFFNHQENQWIQIGIITPENVTRKKVPGIYTRVESYVPWIKQNIKIFSSE